MPFDAIFKLNLSICLLIINTQPFLTVMSVKKNKIQKNRFHTAPKHTQRVRKCRKIGPQDSLLRSCYPRTNIFLEPISF